MAESSPLFGFDPSATTVVGNYSKVAEAQGDIADAAAKSKSQKAPFDFLGVGQQIAQVAGVFAEEKNALDAHQAKLRSIEFMQQNENLTGHELSLKIEEEIRNISEGDFSTGYREGALRVLDVGYNKALKRKEEERVASSLNVIQSDFSTQMSSNKANGIPMSETFAQEYATNTAAKFRVPVEYVRNAMVSSYYEDAQMRVMTARNKNDLAAAEAYIAEAGTVLKTPLFLDSRSKKFQPVIDEFKRNLASSIRDKKTEFKEAAALTLEVREGDGTNLQNTFPSNPATYKDLYFEAHDSPAAALNAFKNDYKAFLETQEGRDYVANLDFYATGNKEIPTGNAYTKPEVERLYQAEVFRQLSNGRADKVITLINYNQDLAEGLGEKLVTDFFSASDPKALTEFKTKMERIRGFPGGSQALITALGSDYKDVMGTFIIADTYTNGDMLKAKDKLAQGKANMGSSSIDPKLFTDLYTYKKALGSMGDEFEYAVNLVNSIDTGSVDSNMLKKIYKRFEGSRVSRNGVTFDTAKGDAGSNLALDAIEPFNNQLIEHITGLNSGVPPKEVRNLGKGVVVYTDEWGMDDGVINTGPLQNIAEALNIAQAEGDKQEISFWGKMGDSWDLIGGQIAYEISAGIFWDEANPRMPEFMAGMDAIWDTPNRPPANLIAAEILKLREAAPIDIPVGSIKGLDGQPDELKRLLMIQENIQKRAFIEGVAKRIAGGNMSINNEDTTLQYDPTNTDVLTELVISP